MKITVVGSGGWGTALAIHLCKNGHEVTLWSHNPEKAASMTSTRVNPMLPGAILPPELVCSGDPASVRGRDMVVLASPSFPFRGVCQTIAPHLDPQSLLVSVTKGIEPETLLRMSQVAGEVTGHTVAVLSGPSHAEEVAGGFPQAVWPPAETRRPLSWCRMPLCPTGFVFMSTPMWWGWSWAVH